VRPDGERKVAGLPDSSGVLGEGARLDDGAGLGEDDGGLAGGVLGWLGEGAGLVGDGRLGLGGPPGWVVAGGSGRLVSVPGAAGAVRAGDGAVCRGGLAGRRVAGVLGGGVPETVPAGV
jgi:hypothetical protein